MPSFILSPNREMIEKLGDSKKPTLKGVILGFYEQKELDELVAEFM